MALAIFDLDETLISTDSDHEWGRFLADRSLVDPVEHRKKNDHFYRQYRRGDLDIKEYLRFACSVLTPFDLPALQAHRREFMDSRIEPHILPQALQLIDSHRRAGDFPMVITSTLQFVVEPIVARLGIDTLIAPVPELVNQRFTGEIRGVPSYAEGKLLRLRQWLEGEGAAWDMTGSYFYSDSCNDLPLLNKVDNPVAVDPDDRLRRVAEEKHWKIISLRG